MKLKLMLLMVGWTVVNAVTALGGVLHAFQTQYARIQVDERGFITSLVSLQSGKEYSPAGHPSPVMSLHEYRKPYRQLLMPVAASFDAGKKELTLKYPNGAVAIVKAMAKQDYFRFQLLSLTPRGDVDNIVWGPLNTTIRGKIGDLIGVVRDPDWAIGMFGLDDNTIAGPPVDGDCYEMGYYVHSPNPKKWPVPAKYHEGERFRVGGNGVSDVAFYSHPQEYFNQVFGTGASLEPAFGSTIAYHSRDRRRAYTYDWSLLPGFRRSRPRHQVSDPVPGVDFIGSAVALYACPDDLGLHVIEQIVLAEGLPHIVIAGKWIRNPASFKPKLFWNGPYDKCLKYAQALGFKDISRDTGAFYPSRGNHWMGGGVRFANGRTMTGKAFMEEAHRAGMTTFGGLHTLCLFLQGGICRDVTPVPSVHLQTVCRTRLAHDISATDTNIVVTAPSFLGERGTWPNGDRGNYLRIGKEMLSYQGITQTPPYTLIGVKRGHASKATPHHAGDIVAKLQQNCYNGFCPDMTLMPKYADYYARLMVRNGLECIDFDGLESTVYMNQGYYGVRAFFRRLFDTYARLTGGKAPRVTGSCVFAGGWLYMDACNVGGGNHMFDPIRNRWGIEGKDVRNGFENSYYPGTFGIQNWNSSWSLYDAEDLEAKSIGWGCTYALNTSQSAIEKTGEKNAIIQAFHAWEQARDEGLFTKAMKQWLRNMKFKEHIVQTGPKSFTVYRVKEDRFTRSAGRVAAQAMLANHQHVQPLQFALRMDGNVQGCDITLPDGTQAKTHRELQRGQFILCQGGKVLIADHNRNPIADIPLSRAPVLPAGTSRLRVRFPEAGAAKVRFGLTVWILGNGKATADTGN